MSRPHGSTLKPSGDHLRVGTAIRRVRQRLPMPVRRSSSRGA